MSAMKTPGVYVVEKNAFPNSVVEVATAVPAFIGFTEKAKNGTKSLLNVPWRISSLAEFAHYFGEAPKPKFSFDKTDDSTSFIFLNTKDADSELKKYTKSYTVSFAADKTTDKYYSIKRTDKYNLYYNLRFFFANGGGACYIVSVGGYKDDFSQDKLAGGINALLKAEEPTMVLVPEAVCLDTPQNCYDIQTAVLKHCGELRDRIAILDIYDGYKDRNDPSGNMVTKFREAIGTEFLDYASAYYPWLNTSIVGEGDISFANITSGLDTFKAVLKSYTPQLSDYIDQIGNDKPEIIPDTVHKTLYKQSPFYASIMKSMVEEINLLPPSAAMAGIYSMTDHTKEVWKAPANTGLANVITTAVNISHADQEDLNIPLDGKAVNAIRYFTGEGIKVWGARTLDGNSLDWRYINVRRTMIMLEQSIKNAAKPFVFDPNVANTWVVVKSTINNFLNGIWKRGGLAGAIPDDAFSVHVGLGDTMTPEDVLEGIMRITVLVAISRPAEFIEITFMQQMQKS